MEPERTVAIGDAAPAGGQPGETQPGTLDSTRPISEPGRRRAPLLALAAALAALLVGAAIIGIGLRDGGSEEQADRPANGGAPPPAKESPQTTEAQVDEPVSGPAQCEETVATNTAGLRYRVAVNEGSISCSDAVAVLARQLGGIQGPAPPGEYTCARGGQTASGERVLGAGGISCENAADGIRITGYAPGAVSSEQDANGDETPPGVVRAGPVTATGVGEVGIDTTSTDVSGQLGSPDEQRFLPSTQEPVEYQWAYELPGGDLLLTFDAQTNRLNHFVSESSELATSSGVAVGDAFAPVRERYADELRQEPPTGSGSGAGYRLSEGKPGTYPALTFGVEDGGVASIRGGKAPLLGE